MFVAAFEAISTSPKGGQNFLLGAPLYKKAQNKHTKKFCVSPAMVTYAAGTMPCYCHPTSPKNPPVTAAGLEQDGNTRNPTRTHCRSSAGLDEG